MAYLEGIHSSMFHYWNKYHLYSLIIFPIHLGKIPNIGLLKHKTESLQGKDNTGDFWKLVLSTGISCIDQLIGYILFYLGSIHKSE